MRTTSPTIWWTDRIAKHVIAIGGIGTIAAVLLVFVFLLSVAIPLFRPAKVSESTTWSTPWKTNGAILSAVNEYRTIGWALFPAGKIHGYSLTDGSVIGEPISVLSEENSSELSAAALSIDGSFITLGFSDGTIRQGSVSFDTTFVELADAEPALRDLPENEARASNGGIVQRIPNGLLRHQKLKLTLDPPVSTGGSAKVLLIDGINGKNGPILASLTADGKLRLSAVTRQTNLLTDEVEQTVENSDLPLAKFTDPPRYLLV
ncbi:MAG: hypothetical protein SGJ20_15115, partial [Planctomycetota bacterium]|nr:hypothetical protein [Planctomycetota bacterium]